jgi:hypothetical protein
MNEPPSALRDNYSPHLRTALLLTGTGTAGAYHAGVLRALQEAGVKIDVMCGRGMGVAGAMFAAVDGSATMWEPAGIWRSHAPARFYRLRPALAAAAWLLGVSGAVLGVPVLVLATGLIAYPLAFLAQMISPALGQRLVGAYTVFVSAAFAPAALPTVVPRLITLMLVLVLVTLAGAAALPLLSASGRRRRMRGPWWGRLLGAPWTAAGVVRRFERSLWQLIRGPTALRLPPPADLSRRYVELLTENLGQPGFRELIVTVHDIDARCDLICAALAERYRREFFGRADAGDGRRPGEAIDLTGVGRQHAFDAMAGALSLPVLTDAHVVTFAAESYWRGEMHRVCDREAATDRLLREIAAAGVEQVIVASAAPDRVAPHDLRPRRADLRARVSEHVTAAEAASLHDAVGAHQGDFHGVFLIQPTHQPVGPFDFAGCFDERSDRYHTLSEVIDRGYEDAYRQFVDPVVGAGGEKLQTGSRG